MNDAYPITKTLSLLGSIWILATLILSLLLTGCGNKKNQGIEAEFLADFSNSGIGDNDSYSDSFINPDIFTIGVKSVQLIKADDTAPSYTVFDTKDASHPIVLDLTTTAQEADTNPVFPAGCACDFSKVQVELTLIEMQVPTYENTVPVSRRFRFYTLDLTDPDLGVPVQAGDVLVGDISSTPHFSWINTDNGDFVALTGSRPIVPLQVPASLFPDHSYAATVTIDLPSFLKIPDNPKNLITVTLTVHAGELFFYDETDAVPPDSTRFDRFTDGRLNVNEPDSHFYPTFPAITATAK
jgi:hypothetical protein